MIAVWMVYATLVMALLAAAAHLAEAALRPLGRPIRGLWLAALGAGVVWPVALVALGAARPTPAPASANVAGGPAADGVASVPLLGPAWQDGLSTVAGGLAVLDVPLLVLWGAASAGGLVLLLAGARALRRERRSWRRLRLEGVPVHLSETRGPAVFGFLRPRIVLPDWVEELAGEAREAVVLHELEHLRAGDHRLLLVGLAAVTVMPWNPAAWWASRRLSTALELDCDRRVLARGVSRRLYGRLLLDVAARGTAPRPIAPALAERGSTLQRRIDMMIEPTPRRPVLRAAGALAAGALLIAGACELPAPPEPGSVADEPPAAERSREAAGPSAPSAAEASERPSFIPYDEPPRLQNPEEVRDALLAAYPSALWEAGVEGRVELWMLVGEDGLVRSARVKTSSDVPVMDEAARQVTSSMRFSPALNRDRPTDVWVTQWITFQKAP